MLIYCPDTNLIENRRAIAFYKVLDSDINALALDEKSPLRVSRGNVQEEAYWHGTEGKFDGFIWTSTWKIGGKGNIEHC